jgi:hypothetical protein
MIKAGFALCGGALVALSQAWVWRPGHEPRNAELVARPFARVFKWAGLLMFALGLGLLIAGAIVETAS